MEKPLKKAEKDQLFLVLRLGCNRATACKYTGVTMARLLAAIECDAPFAQEFLQAESQPEVRHMSVINTAAQEEKNWRTSAWWLDRRKSEQGDGADGAAWNPVAAMRDALDRFADIVIEEIPDLARRQPVLIQLMQIADEAGPLAMEPVGVETSPAVPTPMPTGDTEAEP